MSGLEPMLCTLGALPADEARWSFEPKWDGFRALVRIEGARVRVLSRNGTDLTDRCPELAPLARSVRRPCFLDGELVVLDAEGKPDFEAMRRRGLLDKVRHPCCSSPSTSSPRTVSRSKAVRGRPAARP